MAHNETRNGLNETERLPRTWSRSTVADGQWMQKNTLGPYRNSDWFLASAIDGLLDKDDELTQAIADETAARQQNDSDLSAWCRNLESSAEDLYTGLATEISDRKQNCNDASAHAYDLSKSYTDTASAYVFGHADDASAHALAEAKTYANDTSSYLNGRINGVSSTFNSFSSDLKTWKDGVENWEGGIDTWKSGIDDWREDSVDPKLISLQEQIDTFEQATDVADVVSTSGDLDGYNKTLTKGAIIKVLSAGPNNDQQYYYKNKLTKTSAGPFHIDNFEVLGSVQPYYSKSEIDSNYYKKTETYTKTEVDNYLKWKVDANTSQNFNTDQKWQARQNIGASDGKIQWTNYIPGPGWQVTSADLTITKAITGDNYYRLRLNDGTTTQDWALVPKPADNTQYGDLLTFTSTGISWKTLSAELPPVTRPADVGKALVVGSEGLSWDDRGKGLLTVDASNLTTNTYNEISAAVAAGKDVILDRDTGMGTHSVSHIYADWYKTAQFTRIYGEYMWNSSISQGSDTLYERRYRLLWTSAQDLSDDEQAQVRKNIDISRSPLVIWMRYPTQTLTDAEMRDIARAVDNSTVYYSPLIYIAYAEGTTTRYYRLSLYRGNDSYIFSSTDDKDMSYIQVIISSKEATLHRQLRFWKANYLPDFSSNQETYYVI